MVRLLNSGINSAIDIMSLDERLLEQIDEPIIHLYEWANPSATYGYFIQPEQHLYLEKAKERGIDLARRPTGGGIVFHIWDLAFSFLLPKGHPAFSDAPLQNYHFVNSIVLDVVRSFFPLDDSFCLTPEHGKSLGPDCQNFCMAKPTQYDVMYRGRKIAGSAQRKRRNGYLHQGTISLALPNIDLLKCLLRSQEEVLAAMESYTFAPLGERIDQLPKTRQEIQKLLASKLKEAVS